MKLDFLLYQMDVIFGKPDENMEKVREMLDDLQPGPGTIVVLPELFLTGYSREGIEKAGQDFSTGRYVAQLMEEAAKYDIAIFGSIPEFSNSAYFNTAILLDRGGVQFKYRKSHLFGPMGEKSLFKPGRDIITVDYADTKFGLSICYDLRFPELYQIQAKQGAVVNLICAEWPITRVDHWRSLTKARAIENQAFVVAVNRVGKDPDYHYGGHSAVFSPFGKMVTGMNHDDEAIVECQVDLDELASFREKFDVRDDKWIEI